jgi:hypothetical protein
VALLVIESIADLLPALFGSNMMLTVQEPAGGIGDAQELVCANIAASVPLSDTLPIASAAVPVFEIVMV